MPTSIDPVIELPRPSDFTPALVLSARSLTANLDEMIRIAGRPSRLRPHCKTTNARSHAIELAKGL